MSSDRVQQWRRGAWGAVGAAAFVILGWQAVAHGAPPSGWQVPGGTHVAAAPAKVYVSSPHGIYVIETSTGSLTDTWTAYTDATDLALSSDSSTLYMTRSSAGVSEFVGISTADGSTTATWQAPGCDPVGIDVRGTTAYLACSMDRWVATQDLTQASGAGFSNLTGNWTTDTRTVRGIGVSPDNSRIYVATSSGFLVYDGTGALVTATQRGTNDAYGMLFNKGYAWQINVGDNTVSGVDTAGDDWIPRGALHFAGLSRSLADGAYASDGSRIYALVGGVVKVGNPAKMTGLDPFGSRAAGVPETRTATFYNYGPANASIPSIGLINPDGAFAVVGGTCAPSLVVTVGGSCTVAVKFTPPASGSVSGAVTVWTNGNGEDGVRLYLSGTGVTPSNLQAGGNFDTLTVAVGTTHDETYTVKNTGVADLHVDSASITANASGGFAVVSQTCAGATLRRFDTSGDTCTVTVSYSATSLGVFQRSANLHFVSDSGNVGTDNRDYALHMQVAGQTGGGFGSLGWGYDNSGQAACARAWPETVTSVSAGSEATAAVTTAGTVIGCGQLPGSLTTATDVVQVTGGGVAVLHRDGTVSAEGGDAAVRSVPAALGDSATARVAAISGFWRHIIALREDGTVVSWGASVSGRDQQIVPTEFTDSRTAHVVAVDADTASSTVLREDGTVASWGEGTVPAELTDSSTAHVVGISASGGIKLAVRANGTVVAWGSNCFLGCLRFASNLVDVVRVAGGGDRALAQLRDGTLVAWDKDGNALVTPTGISNITQIAAGPLDTFLVLRGTGATDRPLITNAPTAASISRGQTLAASTLTGGLATYRGAPVAGSFAFTTPSTAPAIGTALHTVVFTPSDTVTYQSVYMQVPVSVGKARPIITETPTATTLVYGQTLAASALTGGGASGLGESVTGTFAWSDTTTAPSVGTGGQPVLFTPSDTGTYESVTLAVSVTMVKATPVVTETPTAQSITAGKSLADATLSGGVARFDGVVVTGTFAFADTSTTPVPGLAQHTVVFTPTNMAGYETVTVQVDVTVVSTALTVTETPTATGIWTGQSLASSTLSGGVAQHDGQNVTGSFAFADTTTVPAVGTHPQLVIFTPTDTSAYDTVTVYVPVTATTATTSVLYTGGLIASVGARLPVSASTTSPIDCGTPVYVLSPNPFTGTDTLTLTPVAGYVDTTGWREGVYQLTVTFGAGGICTPSSDDATLTIAAPGAAATGAAKYTLSGIGRVSASFTVRAVPNSRPLQYKGQFLLINNGKWRLKATVSTYVKSGTTGAISGTGALQWWNQALNGGLGAWVVAQSPVTYTANFTATTKSSPGTFGVKITYTPVGDQPGKLPNSAATTIKGGSISLA